VELVFQSQLASLISDHQEQGCMIIFRNSTSQNVFFFSFNSVYDFFLLLAEAVFDIEYFKTNPLPFYQLSKELMPTKYKPTPTHLFIKLLQEKGLLTRFYIVVFK